MGVIPFSCCGYGLTDLVRLEKLLLKQIAGDYFRLTPANTGNDDDDGKQI